ncbi:MAG: alpha/beta hydrolase [Bacteroidales bacterium]|nr:alpha/beta hydrolase [Bacteroidales bacterium]
MRCFVFIIILFFVSKSGNAQIETHWADTTIHPESEKAYFFTNRKPKKTDDGSVAFRNRWTRQTDNLYFCLFDYEGDSILLKYQATKTCEKHEFPTDAVENNMFHRIFYDLTVRKGIKRINFIVPGYAKTFKAQVYNYMYRLEEQYGDALQENTVFITYAWGTQAMPEFYYKAKRSANRAANDFAIFQHLLEDFLADSAFFAQYPDDVKINLVCMSMGNQLLKRYMIKREKQDIDFVPVYNWTVFIGSDAAYDSFDEGKGFDNLELMSDSVLVLVNRKDGPLRMSRWMNAKTRLGISGPRHLETLPDNVVVWDITSLISWEDLPAMGHDYFLRNQEIRDSLIHMQSKLP